MAGITKFDFSGESAIVTGSTRGIGRGIANALASSDANVLIVSRSAEDVDEVVDELSTHGEGLIVGTTADVGEPADIEAMVETATDAFGTVDLLVNNAAMWPAEETMLYADLDEWDTTMAVNVRSQYYASVLVGRHMVENDVRGSIINVSSQTGDRRTGGRGLYGISKTAINGLTWRMAHDFAEYGIRVNAISTDITDTSQLRRDAETVVAEDSDRTVDDVIFEWGESIPIGRLGRPADLGHAVCYLASDQASYVVGHILRVSGGGNLQ